VQVRLNGHTYTIHFARRQHAAGGTAGQEEIRASMPGVVVAVHAAAGQPVQGGDRLLTLESMKLQMTIVAAHPGVVEQVHVQPEAVFERGALLVSFAREEVAKP
jgi:3-methylcrotonyl-CoA carboxylase alpha subunit